MEGGGVIVVFFHNYVPWSICGKYWSVTYSDNHESRESFQ
jgi:hypothetical protein